MVEIDGEDVPETDLVRKLGDKYSVEVLSVTQEPQSAKDISELLDIPIATSYRRIEDLSEMGLLTFEEKVLTEERRRRDTYRRSVDEIDISFEEFDFSISVREHVTVENKLEGMWRDLSHSDSSDDGF